MISIIICSVNKKLLGQIMANIELTIGVEHEIIAFDNLEARLGIAEAYNLSARKAIYPYICFMHEDILFETREWGKKVIAHLSDKDLGLIGVAGGDTKGIVPSSWSSSAFESEMSIIQHFRLEAKAPELVIKTGYPDDLSNLKKVVCIDGVWMCTRKEVFEKFQFDQAIINSFHGYDIDFSLQVQSAYAVGVVFDIIFHHFSEGTFNREWVQSCIRVSDKWRDKLPRSVRDLSQEDYVRQHWTSMNVFIDKMLELDYTRFFMGWQLIRYSTFSYFHLMHFLHSCRKIIFKVTG